MGTYYTEKASRKDLIAELTQPNEDKSTGFKHQTLRHCLGGNVLWTVEEVSNPYIGCYLLRPDPSGWGYKPMEESIPAPCHI